jgi:outer membrane protein assembly factor BamB
MVVNDVVIVHLGGRGKGALLALEPASGKVRWGSGEDGPSYASPIIATVAGKRQLITQTETNIASIDPASGALLWQIPYSRFGEQNIITPVVAGDLVVYGGWGKPTVAISLNFEAGSWTTRERWRNEDLWMNMSSPVVARDVLYGFSQRNRGQFVAVDTATGHTLWKSNGNRGDYSAIVAAANGIVATTTEGQLLIQPFATSAFQPQVYSVSNGPIWSYPVPTARGLLVRSLSSVSLWRF